MTAPPFLRGFRCAIIFLTRVPVGGDGYRDADWRWSTGWFPVIGLLIGLLLASLWWLCSPRLSPWTIAALSLSISQLLTGGFHEDGLADTADALGGAYTGERIPRFSKTVGWVVWGDGAFLYPPFKGLTLGGIKQYHLDRSPFEPRFI